MTAIVSLDFVDEMFLPSINQSVNQSIEEFVTRTVVDGSSRIRGAGSRRAG